jgi:predicted SnoaL-like aldol condensation-catalyzing enzyme
LNIEGARHASPVPRRRDDRARARRLRRRRQADGREQEGRAAAHEAAINQKDFEAASKFLGPRYIQHNPRAADGPAGLKAFLAYLREQFPDYHSEIKRVFADGDYVILHVHNVPTPGSRGNAIIDIFRLENGKVVEHWDVRQEIPEQAANSNTMF